MCQALFKVVYIYEITYLSQALILEIQKVRQKELK